MSSFDAVKYLVLTMFPAKLVHQARLEIGKGKPCLQAEAYIEKVRNYVTALPLLLIFAAIMAVANGIKYNSPADAAALPSSAKAGNETTVRATKGDRLDARPEIRKIAGVTVVLRDFGRTIR